MDVLCGVPEALRAGVEGAGLAVEETGVPQTPGLAAKRAGAALREGVEGAGLAVEDTGVPQGPGVEGKADRDSAEKTKNNK